MKNDINTITNPIFTGSYSPKKQSFLQNNAQKHMEDSPTKPFKEILKTEMAKLQ